MNVLIRMQQATIVCLCRLTVRASDIAQTDEFPLFMRYFRLHCLDTSEHVNYEKLLNWQDMITKSKEGQLLTVEERIISVKSSVLVSITTGLKVSA